VEKRYESKPLARYEDVAARIVDLIESGAYKAGEKIPSLRELADSLKLSVNTVRDAYALLEEQRYIQASPQSGYYVIPRVAALSCTLSGPDPVKMDPQRVSLCRVYSAFLDRGSAADACGLGIATLSADMWPTEKMQKCAVDAVRFHDKEFVEYMMAPGYAPLREQLAIQGLSGGSRLSPDRLIVTSGCQESMYLALACLTSPGDTVAVESPIYFNLLKMMESLRLNVLEIPCSADDGMHLETLRFALDHYSIAAVLTIANFHNPTGSLMPDAKKEELVRLLSKKGIPLIEDDIYGELSFGSERPRTCQSFDTDGTVLYCSSISKTISPGMRIGWIEPGRWYDAIENMKNLVNLGTSSIPQIATAIFLQDGAYVRHIRRLRLQLKEKMAALRSSVLEHFPEGTRATDPEGGMVLWVSLPEKIKALELYRLAMESGIVIAPGPLFSLQDRFTSDIRLNAGIWSPSTNEKIQLVGSLARSLL
jgi:DNA-binding transcriptional MocR family regulator